MRMKKQNKLSRFQSTVLQLNTFVQPDFLLNLFMRINLKSLLKCINIWSGGTKAFPYKYKKSLTEGVKVGWAG